VRELAARVTAAVGEDVGPATAAPEVPVPDVVAAGGVDLLVEEVDDGARVTVVAPDRIGLLADVAAMFALQRASVRAARAWSQDDVAVSTWDVADQLVDPAVLRQRLDAVVERRIEPAARLLPATRELAPTVGVRPEASHASTVIEVRAADRPGVLHLTLAALAALDVTVCSAHVDTLGPQAVDVFYVQEAGAGALSETRAAEAAHAVRAVLGGDLSVLGDRTFE
jgi:[protein-PII] uridylyltransferase